MAYPTTDEAVIEDFRLWLVDQDPLGEYSYTSVFDCCFAQYLKAREYAIRPLVRPCSWQEFCEDDHGEIIASPSSKIPAFIDVAVAVRPRTFGGALNKLNELLTA